MYPELRLKSIDVSRFARGHLWIYSNEIQGKLKRFSPGEIVRVVDRSNRLVGTGYVNPKTLIACRLLDRNEVEIDVGFFVKKFSIAKRLREELGLLPFARVLFSEGDMVSGIIADMFGKAISVQLRTLGMLKLKDMIIEALDRVFEPDSIVIKNDFAYADYEGIERHVEVVKGKVEELVRIEEDGIVYLADLLHGQKTGFYYDQRENRRFVRQIVKGKRVLELFSYTGGFALAAAAGGAEHVIAVDSSEPAIELAKRAASLNSFQNVEFIQANVFELLSNMKEQFDIILADPPAFIQNKKSMNEGLAHYRRLHALLMKRIKPSGLLITSSCSYNLFPEKFLEIISSEATKAGMRPAIFYQGRQSADHPINPAMPETFYLKTFGVYLPKA